MERGGNGEGRVLTVGFIPLLDCALLVVAHEKGFAEDNGIRLRLVREVSWANIRDRVAFGHFDAAHMLGPMVVAASLLEPRVGGPLLAPAAMGLGGNAITVSGALWRAMAIHGAVLGASPDVQAGALARVITERRQAGEPPLTLAMVFPFSCHNYQLRDWLASADVDPDRDVRLVVVPPPMLVEALRTGQVDGFCVGEPWNSLAVDAGLGTIVAVASDIWSSPPEKVLGLRAEFVAKNADIVRALVRALTGAARWASDVENRPELVQLLSQPRYVGAPARLLEAALAGRIVPMTGAAALVRPDFITLDEAATVPQTEHARMLAGHIQRWGQAQASAADLDRAANSYRPDLHCAIAADVSAARVRPG